MTDTAIRPRQHLDEAIRDAVLQGGPRDRPQDLRPNEQTRMLTVGQARDAANRLELWIREHVHDADAAHDARHRERLQSLLDHPYEAWPISRVDAHPTDMPSTREVRDYATENGDITVEGFDAWLHTRLTGAVAIADLRAYSRSDVHAIARVLDPEPWRIYDQINGVDPDDPSVPALVRPSLERATQVLDALAASRTR